MFFLHFISTTKIRSVSRPIYASREPMLTPISCQSELKSNEYAVYGSQGFGKHIAQGNSEIIFVNLCYQN